MLTESDYNYVQRFRANRGLLGSEAGKGRPLDLGRMSANGSKTVYWPLLRLQRQFIRTVLALPTEGSHNVQSPFKAAIK